MFDFNICNCTNWHSDCFNYLVGITLKFYCMLAENIRKNSKFKFEDYIADFIWDINPNDANGTSDESYRNLLKSVFVFDPAAHDYDKERFKINFDEI